MVLFTRDVEICQMDQRRRCQKRAKNVMCEQGLTLMIYLPRDVEWQCLLISILLPTLRAY